LEAEALKAEAAVVAVEVAALKAEVAVVAVEVADDLVVEKADGVEGQDAAAAIVVGFAREQTNPEASLKTTRHKNCLLTFFACTGLYR
jgi:hypothetical protein